MLPLNLREDLLRNTEDEDVCDAVAEKMFKMVGDIKINEPTETQLEIGFRMIKTKLDESDVDYRQEVFGLPAKN